MKVCMLILISLISNTNFAHDSKHLETPVKFELSIPIVMMLLWYHEVTQDVEFSRVVFIWLHCCGIQFCMVAIVNTNELYSI